LTSHTYKNAALAGLLGLLLLGASACNTMEGLGEDIESGGENLQDEAEYQQEQM
jgi:predicted small secreted protein